MLLLYIHIPVILYIYHIHYDLYMFILAICIYNNIIYIYMCSLYIYTICNAQLHLYFCRLPYRTLVLVSIVYGIQWYTYIIWYKLYKQLVHHHLYIGSSMLCLCLLITVNVHQNDAYSLLN